MADLPTSAPPTQASQQAAISSSSPSSSPPPKALLNVDDYHAHARLHLPKSVYDYFANGAHDQLTLADNVAAYQRLLLRPRFLIDVSGVQLHTTILGAAVTSPIAIAPTAMQRLAHPDGELATARAAASRGVLFALSSLSTTSLEDVASCTSNHINPSPSPSRSSSPSSSPPPSSSLPPRWYQLYVYKDRSITATLVRRATAAGYSAILLTIDTPQLGVREADQQNRFSLPSHLSLANFSSPPSPSSPFSPSSSRHNSHSTIRQPGSGVGGAAEEGGGSGLQAYMGRLADASLSWRDLAWLRSLTPLPLILKGVLTAEDAALACEAGVAGVLVSNHGGRQLDGVAASVEALVEVVEEVRRREKEGEVEVYVDGGVRRGTDVFKALALGARAVFIGRPVLWGLTYAGEEGVRQVLSILHQELQLCMALAGCPTLSSITRAHLTTSHALLSNL